MVNRADIGVMEAGDSSMPLDHARMKLLLCPNRLVVVPLMTSSRGADQRSARGIHGSILAGELRWRIVSNRLSFGHVIPRGTWQRVPGMLTKRIIKIQSGVRAGFDPQPEPPFIVNIASRINVIRVISK